MSISQSEIALKISQDGQIKSHMEGYASAKETVQNTSTLTVMDDLIRLFGADTIANDWPVPDTTAAESNNPDRVAPQNGQAKGRRGRKQKTISWYFTLVDQFSFAENLQKEIDLLVDAGKDSPTIAGNKYARHDKQSIKSLTASTRQRLTAYREVVKKAVKVVKKLAECSELEKVSITILRDPNDPTKVRNTPRPIIVSDANSPSDFRDVSVSTFLRYNVVKARDAGGRAADLWESAARGGNGKGDAPEKGVNSTEDVISTTSDLVSYLTQGKMKGHILHAVDSMEEGEDLLVNLFHLEHWLDEFLQTRDKKTGKSYYEIASEIAEGDEDEQAETTGAETVAA